jgi:chitodextrinase
MSFFSKFGAAFLVLGLVAVPAARATITSLAWNQAPPAITTQNFYVSVSTASDTPECVFLVLLRNGVAIGYASPDEGESDATINVYTGISGNNTTFMATASECSSSQTMSISAVVNETTPPTTPANLASSNLTATSLTLSWTASTDNVGVTGYEVRVDATSLGTATGTSRNLTGLLPNIAYSLTVRARDEFGNWSNWSTAFPVTLIDTTAPSAPGAFASPSHTSTSVSLSWSASSDDVGVAGYDIYRTWGGGNVFIGSTTSGTLTFSDIHVQAGGSYAYHAKARDSSGNVSVASGTANVTADAFADSDSDGIPDALETLFGILSHPNPSSNSNHNLMIHRPHQ